MLTGVQVKFLLVKVRMPQPPHGLQAGLEDGRGLEADRLRCSDLHGFSGLRVTALASGTLFDFKSSKTNDLDFRIFFYACGNGGEDGIEGFFRRTLGGIFSEGCLDGFNQFRFVHGSDVCANAAGAWQEKIC